MKLTLAMGVQFDNGQQASMVALNLGQNKQSSMQADQRRIETTEAIEAAVVRADPAQTEVDQGGGNGLRFNPPSTMPDRKSDPLFFLTYNFNGLNDTLVFEHSLVDIYA
ncbi:hypothetical protein D8Y20_01545 [Mariprofundus sp. EBB-1]|uniref:hypothetical protein n=1 Tax=Mariprofundus sp. EBB-1 TaxID=2650971 RepID=UPI000EF2063A|nr:hypothetical protein [Mariprofundus sp. EBB-1]RLL55612.1 hypothetical protein D8Y20_01545 [Mariprofundus sp. EBB-1]